MTGRWQDELTRTAGTDKIYEIDRSPMTTDPDEGYVVGAGADLILLQALDPNLYLNGYSVIRVADIDQFRELDDHDSFAHRALKLRNISPTPLPAVSLESIETALRSAAELYPLLSIHCEQIDNEVCFIGQLESLTETDLTLKLIDPGANWDETKTFDLLDITKIDFGGAYEDALWLVAQQNQG